MDTDEEGSRSVCSGVVVPRSLRERSRLADDCGGVWAGSRDLETGSDFVRVEWAVAKTDRGAADDSCCAADLDQSQAN